MLLLVEEAADNADDESAASVGDGNSLCRVPPPLLACCIFSPAHLFTAAEASHRSPLRDHDDGDEERGLDGEFQGRRNW